MSNIPSFNIPTAYERVLWKNNETPLNSENLNKSEEALSTLLGNNGIIQKVHNDLNSLDQTVDENNNKLQKNIESVSSSLDNLSTSTSDTLEAINNRLNTTENAIKTNRQNIENNTKNIATNTSNISDINNSVQGITETLEDLLSLVPESFDTYVKHEDKVLLKCGNSNIEDWE